MKRLTIIAFFCVFFSIQLLAIHKLAVTEFLETNIEIDIDDIIFDDEGNDASVLNVYLDWDDVTFKGDTLSCKKATFAGASGEEQQGYIVHMGKSPAFIYCIVLT